MQHDVAYLEGARAINFMWSVYLLQEICGSRTYVGASLDIDRRLKQHNGQQSGGAKATAGRSWRRICHVTGFPHERAALQFEWAWKNLSKKELGAPLTRRTKALKALFEKEQSTSKATDYQEYVGLLEVVWEDECPLGDYLES
jgi:predicted GIY-YIG superfamily endonuclease